MPKWLLLLSMPIPPAAILGSRLGLILILTYIFEGIVFVPAGIVYLLNYGASAPGILFYCLGYSYLRCGDHLTSLICIAVTVSPAPDRQTQAC